MADGGELKLSAPVNARYFSVNTSRQHPHKPLRALAGIHLRPDLARHDNARGHGLERGRCGHPARGRRGRARRLCQTQLAEREVHTGGPVNHTDVVMLEASLLGIEDLGDQVFPKNDLLVGALETVVGNSMDTGNPVFVAEHPMTTVEELGPYAVCLHLRDSVVYEVPEGIAVKWVPLGEGTVDFKAIVARAAQILPEVYIYCKPITGRPPVTIPVYSEEFWSNWFPRGRSRDLARFIALAKTGKPYDKAEVAEDEPKSVAKFMDAMKIQQLEHMDRSLAYCHKDLDLGVRWRG